MFFSAFPPPLCHHPRTAAKATRGELAMHACQLLRHIGVLEPVASPPNSTQPLWIGISAAISPVHTIDYAPQLCSAKDSDADEQHRANTRPARLVQWLHSVSITLIFEIAKTTLTPARDRSTYRYEVRPAPIPSPHPFRGFFSLCIRIDCNKQPKGEIVNGDQRGRLAHWWSSSAVAYGARPAFDQRPSPLGWD